MGKAPGGDDTCLPLRLGESVRRYWPFGKGALGLFVLLAAAFGQEGLCLTAQALLIVGDAVYDAVK